MKRNFSDFNTNKDRPGLNCARVMIFFPHMVMAGGALNYMLHLAEQIMKRGTSVSILTLSWNPRLLEVPEGVEVIDLGGGVTSSLRYWLSYPYWQSRINQAVESWCPDQLVTHVFPSNWWGWLYKRKNPQVKLIWFCHEPSAFIHSKAWIKALKPAWKSLLAKILRPVFKKLDIALAKNTDILIANSKFTAEEAKKIYGINAACIAYPGIDINKYSTREVQRDQALLSVGRLTRFKRVDFLLKVFKAVVVDFPGLSYHIVGTGEQEKSLRFLAKRLGIDSKVIFHGALDDLDLINLYQKSLLFLHGSIDEPFGMAPLEAIAFGTPVMAHRSGGPIEIISDECGRLINSKDIEIWAKEIINYLAIINEDKQLFSKVRKCSNRFDWNTTLSPAIEIIAGP